MRAIFGIVVVISFVSLLISRADIKIPQAARPSPQLTISFAGWQDAVNEKYRYRLKMPHDWSLLQMEGEPAYPQRMKLVNVKPEEQTKPHVGIVITVTPLKVKELKDQPEIAALVAEGREPRQLTMAGSPAMFIDSLGDLGEEFSVFITHKEYLYRFDWTGTHPDVRKQYKDVGLKVLASLQFL